MRTALRFVGVLLVCFFVFVFLSPRQEHGELQLRSDLLDCNVDVCSPEVLVQISDNFDYQVRYGAVRYDAARWMGR